MTSGHAGTPRRVDDKASALNLGAVVGPLIEFVCDEHLTADGVGPFITRHDGGWAYCRGNGASDHRWRRISPTTRAALEAALAPDQKAAG